LKKGLVGIQSFWITFFLFFMTGIAIVLYLNQEPFQPRERDYAYAGSFYAFCIWIGIGVAGIAKLLEEAKLPALIANTLALALCLIVPIQMVSQTWNDHDRSGRYIARDFGHNYLQSCEPNAIIFTYGDNDTFPLWYAQEVEGIRTDVRVCNTSYLQTDWYINQMKRQAYNSDPLPISWKHKDFRQGKRDVIFVAPSKTQPYPLGTILDFIRSDDPRAQLSYYGNYIPTTSLFLRIDSANVVKNRTVNPEHEPFIINEMIFNLEGKSSISKVDAITLDMINTNKWERPMYYAITTPPSAYSLFSDHLQRTGMAYQIVPIKTSENDLTINTQKMYDNVIYKFKWGGLEKPGLYLDETVMRMCKSQRGAIFADLASALINEGKIENAIKVLDRCVEVFPEENVPYDTSAHPLAVLYFTLGENAKAKKIATSMIDKYLTNIDWMLRLNPKQLESVLPLLNDNIRYFQELLRVSFQYDKEFYELYSAHFTNYIEQYKSLFKKD